MPQLPARFGHPIKDPDTLETILRVEKVDDTDEARRAHLARIAKARLQVCGNARDADDARLLLDMLELPTSGPAELDDERGNGGPGPEHVEGT